MSTNLTKVQNEMDDLQALKLQAEGKPNPVTAGIDDTTFLLDHSGSMGQQVEGMVKTRIQCLIEAVESLHVDDSKCVSFSSDVSKGFWRRTHDSTDLTAAFDFVKANCIFKRVLLVSDGEPNNKASALEAAKRLGCPVDVIFIGDSNSAYSGEEYMKQIAEATGGREITVTGAVAQLTQSFKALLTDGKEAIHL